MGAKRGDVYFADLSPVIGSEQGGVRPVLIIQNDVGNKHSPTVITAAITSQQKDRPTMPTHVRVAGEKSCLCKDSIIMLEQVRTIDKQRLRERIGKLTKVEMRRVDKALNISVGLIKEKWR